MRLRQRLVLSLVLISLILVAPAIYGLTALRELRQVALSLQTRDAVGALALGRLQTAFGELENAQRIILALASTDPEIAAGSEEIARVERAMAGVEENLRKLIMGGYRRPAAPAVDAWEELRSAIREERRLILAGEVEAADRHRATEVDPAFAAMSRTLDPIGEAINQAGREQVARAQEIAASAATTTLFSLSAALALAIVIAGWLTRSLVRPIHELRRGMAMVAEGDFEPEVHASRERPDELGDLSRSFHRMAQQLAELDRLKAEFVSVASHELKTPLSVIRGYVSLLRDGVYGEVPDEQHRVLQSVSDQTDRLARLIQQLLDISRFEAGGGRLELRNIDLRAFMEELGTSFEALAMQNDIRFELQTDPDLPKYIVADADRLNEVLGNLLSNAFKFTPRGGEIDLRAVPVDGGIQVEVDDTGVGIPPEMLPRIFEKFFQVENEAQPRSVGSGLGLAIAHEIVDAHGGTITAESEVGKGTTFRVFLPERALPANTHDTTHRPEAR